MQGTKNMQLFLILAIILLGGKSGAQTVLNEVVPVLEQMGGPNVNGEISELKQVIKSAQEISSYMNALGAFRKSASSTPCTGREATANYVNAEQTATLALKPVAKIAPPEFITALKGCLAA